MGIIEWKKTLESSAKNRDGRMIVNKHTFFWPYIIWFASIILFGQEKYRCVTCVSGSLPKTIRIGLSTQLFYFIFRVCAKNLRSVGEPETHFLSWSYLQECRLPLHMARPSLKKIVSPYPTV